MCVRVSKASRRYRMYSCASFSATSFASIHLCWICDPFSQAFEEVFALFKKATRIDQEKNYGRCGRIKWGVSHWLTYGTEDASKINLLRATIHYIEDGSMRNASLDMKKLSGQTYNWMSLSENLDQFRHRWIICINSGGWTGVQTRCALQRRRDAAAFKRICRFGRDHDCNQMRWWRRQQPITDRDTF